MRRIISHICICILLIVAAACFSDVQLTEASKYILVFHEKGTRTSRKNIQGISREERIQEVMVYSQSILKEYGFDTVAPIEVYESVFWGFTAQLSSVQATTLKNDKRIRLVEKDLIYRHAGILQKKPINDPSPKEPWEKGTKDKGSMASQVKPWGVHFIGGGGHL